MRTVSAQFSEAVRGSHERIARVTALDSTTLEVVAEITGEAGVVVDGTVSIDADRRRSCTLTIVDELGTLAPAGPSDVLFLNRLIKVERGIVIDGVPELVSLGLFLIDRPRISVRPSGAVISISGQDRVKLAAKSKVSVPETYAAGTPIADVVRALAAGAGMGGTLIRTNDAGKVLGADRTFEIDADRWPSIRQLAQDFALQAYVDADGFLVLEPAVTPDTMPAPVWAFARGEDAIMLGLDREWNDDRLYNRVRVSGESSDLPPVAAEARDLNPTSPAYNPADGTGPIGDRLYPYTSPMIRSLEQAGDVASALLLTVALVEEQLTVPSIAHPALEVGDSVEIVEPLSRTSDTYLLDTLSIPIGPGEMRSTARKLRDLRSLEDAAIVTPIAFPPSSPPSTVPTPTPTPGPSGSSFPPTVWYGALLTVAGVVPPLPGLLETITDATFGTRVKQISDVDQRRQAYSRIPAFNCTGDKLLLGFNPGSARIHDGHTFAFLYALPGGAIDYAIWSRVDPNKLIGVDISGAPAVLQWQDATTGAKTPIRDFTADGYTSISIGDYEGGISAGDTWIALIGRNGGTTELITYNVVTNTILAHIAAPAGMDNCQISRLGNYVTVGGTGYTRAYLRNLSSFITLCASGNHGDNALDAGGNEIWVGVNCPFVMAFRLSTGVGTQLLPGTTAYEYGHASGCAFDRPGWIYLSNHNFGAVTGRPGIDALTAVKTDGSGDVEIYGYQNHHIGESPYASQPQAVPSPNGEDLVGASNWGADTGAPSLCFVWRAAA